MTNDVGMIDCDGTQWTLTSKYRELRAEVERLREALEDARSYAAEIAQGVSHYPHEEAEPCVRCRAERAEAEVGALQQLAEIRLQESMRQEMAKEQAEAEVERLREALRECQRVFDHPAFTDRAGIGDVVRAALRGER